MKKYIWCYLCLLFLLAACIDDDGNYDYRELAEIKVENVPDVIEVLGYVDHIRISPKFISSTEGEIKAGDPNYSVRYRIGYKGMGSLGGYDTIAQTSKPWVDITPESGFDLDVPANYSPTTYCIWITITDNRINAVTSKVYDVIVSSSTGEGWLVLCNEGPEERARLDMISRISSTRTEPIYDVAKGMPTVHHATCMGFVPKMSNPGDVISIFTREEDYMLDQETLESGAELEFNLSNFMVDPGETLIKEYTFAASTYDWLMHYRFGFSEAGNVYVLVGGIAGEAYGLPINTLAPGTPAEFRVAPYAGYSWVRPWQGSYAANALFYDIDNRRFVMFKGITNFGDEALCLYPLSDPAENRLFSYTTGKDMVYMEGTRRSNGLVYAVLQNSEGKRSLYGINVGGKEPVQELYIDEIQAPDIEKAKHFAFHSQFPLMFYAVDNKVYLYNVGTKESKLMTAVNLGASEEITQIKFNLYRNAVYSALNNQSDEFMDKQYQLIVSSYDHAGEGNDNGKVSFYRVDGIANNITKTEEYTGFAQVVDVVYRERAQ